TSAPVALILALEHGAAFAAAAAAGTMAGTISQAAFSLAYAGLAARGPALAAAAGATAFVLATAALHGLAFPPLLLFVVVTGSLVATPQLRPGHAPARPVTPAPSPRWDLPARMIVATGFVLLLTGLAPVLGPRLTGLLSPFPIYAAVLTIFAQRGGG